MKSNETIKDMESAIRKLQDEKNLLENNTRKLENQLAGIQSDITREKETITELEEQIAETEKSNKQLSGLNEVKHKLQLELDQLSKKLEEAEKEVEINKDNGEKIIQIKSILRNVKNKNEGMVQERERLEKNLSRIKAGMDPLTESERDSGNTSRLAKIEKESAFEKYGRGARDRSAEDRKAEDTKKSREDEKKIRELKTELKNVKREKEREIEVWNKKLITAESNVTKAQSALSKMVQDKKSLQKLIKQEKN